MADNFAYFKATDISRPGGLYPLAGGRVTTCHDVSQRGHVTVTIEDLASALDVENEQISAVLDAMQGRVLEGSKITGWERRQPKKENVGNEETGAKSAAQRKREQRERERKQREEQEANEQRHGNVTTRYKIREDIDLKNNSLSDARAENFIPVPDEEDPPAGNWSDYPGKFVMTGHWQLDPDFSRKAAQWGVILNAPYRPEELAEFITNWQAEGKAKHHSHWEMTFAKSIRQQRMKQPRQSGGHNDDTEFKFNPSSGKSRAV